MCTQFTLEVVLWSFFALFQDKTPLEMCVGFGLKLPDFDMIPFVKNRVYSEINHARTIVPYNVMFDKRNFLILCNQNVFRNLVWCFIVEIRAR